MLLSSEASNSMLEQFGVRHERCCHSSLTSI